MNAFDRLQTAVKARDDARLALEELVRHADFIGMQSIMEAVHAYAAAAQNVLAATCAWEGGDHGTGCRFCRGWLDSPGGDGG